MSDSTFAIFRTGEGRSSCGFRLRRWSGGLQAGVVRGRPVTGERHLRERGRCSVAFAHMAPVNPLPGLPSSLRGGARSRVTNVSLATLAVRDQSNAPVGTMEVRPNTRKERQQHECHQGSERPASEAIPVRGFRGRLHSRAGPVLRAWQAPQLLRVLCLDHRLPALLPELTVAS